MKPLIIATLFFYFVFGSPLSATETNTPAVDPANLATFMTKWKTNEWWIEYMKNEVDTSMLLAAMAKDSHPCWPSYLSLRIETACFRFPTLKKPEREVAACKFVPTLLQADRILTAAIQAKTTNWMDLALQRIDLRKLLFRCLMESGSAYLPEASEQAKALLARLPSTNSWNYGKNVYVANELLGHVALEEGRLEAARDYLRAAGKVPQDYEWFGPGHQLARQLLHHGEPADREAVLAYLADLDNSWTRWAATTTLAKDTAEAYEKQHRRWVDIISAGKIPDDLLWR